MRKKIIIIHTGGTIAMTEDDKGTVKPSAAHPLAAVEDLLAPYAQVEIVDDMHLPSPHITPVHMFDLSQKINSFFGKGQYDAAVVTHGTDTLEETAFVLDLLMHTGHPVIVTGAMRSGNEIGADGPLNLLHSVRVAACNDAAHKGVLVVFNGEIHTAKHVTKTHTSNVNAFQSLQHGALGMVTKHRVVFHHHPFRQPTFRISRLQKRVMLLKAFAGMEHFWLESLLETGMDGLVLEGFGQGNVPPMILPSLKKIIDREIPVVLVSRSANGLVEATYAYEGGGKQLKEMGVLFCHGLTGPKARLYLMAALEQTADLQQLRSYFD